MTQIHGTVATERKKDRQRFTFEFVRASDGKRMVCVGAVGFQREFPNPVLGDKILITGEIYGDEVYASTVEILPWRTAFTIFSGAIPLKEMDGARITSCAAPTAHLATEGVAPATRIPGDAKEIQCDVVPG